MKASSCGLAVSDCFVFFAVELEAGGGVTAVVVSCIGGRALPLLPRCPSMLFGRLVQHRLAHKDISTDQLHLRHALRLQLARGHGSANAMEEVQHASHEGVLDEEVWRFSLIKEPQCGQECVCILENDAVVDVRCREVHSFGEHRTRLAEAVAMMRLVAGLTSVEE